MNYITEPLRLPNGVTLKNRIVVPPMASATANRQGYVTTATLEHYRRLGTSGAGMLMVEYSFVDWSGRSEENQLAADDDEKIPGLTLLADVIHQSNTVAALQLVHAGGKTNRELTGGKLITPSNVSVPTKGTELEQGEEASLVQISNLKEAYLDAAYRADQAGFEVVELHAAHGYGLNQWLSPLTNHRKDQYGGNLVNRARLLFEIVALIKKSIPNLVISVRMPGQDHMTGGLTSDEAIAIAKHLECLGVNIINVSSGIGGWRRPDARNGEGYLVSDAELIQAQVKIPVIGVGGIQSGEYITQSLKQKKFALAAVGRAILENPLWGMNIGILNNLEIL